MKATYCLIWLLLLPAVPVFSQRTVSGTIVNTDGTAYQHVIVREEGTKNWTLTDANGMFSFTTLKDTCGLEFDAFMPGEHLCTPDNIWEWIEITQDTTLHIVLHCYSVFTNYSYQLLYPLGVKYDAINSMVGLTFGNCSELPLETYRSDYDPFHLYYTMYAQTNFYRDYSFGAEVAWKDLLINFRIFVPSIGYEQSRHLSDNFFFRDVHLSAATPLTRTVGKASSLIVKAGYQNLNDAHNFGASVGFWTQLKPGKLYMGMSVGYYFDYLTFSAYVHGRVKRIDYKLSYDRIDNYNFLNAGITIKTFWGKWR
jgi:hypothetical protein